MTEVRLEHVTKRFSEDVAALDDLTLDVADGEFLILVGPSGCGKTTALRLVAGLEKPTSGSIAIGGRIVSEVTPRDRDIAMVFQNYALYPHMTVYRNLAFGLKERRTPKPEIERRVREASAASMNRPAPWWQTALFFALIWSVPGYVVLQAVALWRWRGGWRVAAAIPGVPMAAVVLYTIVAFSAGSNLFPLVLIFSAPPALLYLVILMILRRRRQRTTPRRARS